MSLRRLALSVSLCLGLGPGMLLAQSSTRFVVTSMASDNKWALGLAATDGKGEVYVLQDKPPAYALIVGGNAYKVLPSDACLVELRRSAKVYFKTTLRLADGVQNQALLDCAMADNGELKVSVREWKDKAGNTLAFPAGSEPITCRMGEKKPDGTLAPWIITIRQDFMAEDAPAATSRGRSTTLAPASGKR